MVNINNNSNNTNQIINKKGPYNAQFHHSINLVVVDFFHPRIQFFKLNK